VRGGCRHFLFSSVRVGQVVLSLVLGSQGAPSLLFISLHPRPRLRIVHINKGHIVNTVPPLKHRRPFLLVIVLDSHRVKRER